MVYCVGIAFRSLYLIVKQPSLVYGSAITLIAVGHQHEPPVLNAA